MMPFDRSDVDCRIILKWVLKKYCMRGCCTVIMGLRIGPNGGCFLADNETSGLIKVDLFPDQLDGNLLSRKTVLLGVRNYGK
jgi:hypothetical protein